MTEETRLILDKIGQVDQHLNGIDLRFDRVEQRLNEMDLKFDCIDQRFNEIDAKFDYVDQRFNEIDSKFYTIDQRLNEIDSKFDDIDQRFDMTDKQTKELDQKLTEVQLTLENDINKKIRIIAEGHLDLSRKLDDSLKFSKENEMVLLRVTTLESDVRRLKTKIG